MEPLLKEGNRVLINSLAYLFSKPKLGDIVAFQAESQRGRILLKKINKCLPNNQYFLVGTNKNDSLDSHQFGAIKQEKILGKYLAKY